MRYQDQEFLNMISGELKYLSDTINRRQFFTDIIGFKAGTLGRRSIERIRDRLLKLVDHIDEVLK